MTDEKALTSKEETLDAFHLRICLTNVAVWLENGCEPAIAAKELRILIENVGEPPSVVETKAHDPKRDEKLRQVSLATMDAKLLGCGFVMILPDNSFQHVPLDRIQIKPEISDQEPALEDRNWRNGFEAGKKAHSDGYSQEYADGLRSTMCRIVIKAIEMKCPEITAMANEALQGLTQETTCDCRKHPITGAVITHSMSCPEHGAQKASAPHERVWHIQGAPDCEKCGGAGWLRGRELDNPSEDTYADTMTKYTCDGEKCLALNGLVNGTISNRGESK